jgi:lipoprotein NlpI
MSNRPFIPPEKQIKTLSAYEVASNIKNRNLQIDALQKLIELSGCNENEEFGWEWRASTLVDIIYEFKEEVAKMENVLLSTKVNVNIGGLL